MPCSLLPIVAAIVAVLASAPLVAGERPLKVVELFTSQGCSSCPPADALIGELIDRTDVLALSLHVDYWDHLGWKDTLANPATKLRQSAYAKLLGLGYVYTPQVIVHGAQQVTGSDRAAVLGAIDRATPEDSVQVNIYRGAGGDAVVTIGGSPAPESAAVWLMRFDTEHSALVNGGENDGLTRRTYNSVRNLISIGVWNGQAATISVPVPDPGQAGDGCAVIVQADAGGRILGAGRLMFSAN